MTDRHTADTINDDALDQLYQRLERAEAELRDRIHADSTDATTGSYAHRAEQAEAAIARVRALADRLDGFARTTIRVDDGPFYAGLAADLRRALDHPRPAATEATERPTLRERSRARWNALTPEQQAARMAELDAIDNPDVITDRATIRNTLND